SLPDASRALEWAVRFESVNYRSRAWLNGKPIGTNRGAYIPFEFRLDGLRRHGTNRLVIRVDSRRRPTDFPPSGLATNGAPAGGRSAPTACGRACAPSASHATAT